jgi:hypothetical protein
MPPRAHNSSSTARELRQQRHDHHTAGLMISAGKR